MREFLAQVNLFYTVTEGVAKASLTQETYEGLQRADVKARRLGHLLLHGHKGRENGFKPIKMRHLVH